MGIQMVKFSYRFWRPANLFVYSITSINTVVKFVCRIGSWKLYFLVTDANSCTDSLLINVLEPAPIVFRRSESAPRCCLLQRLMDSFRFLLQEEHLFIFSQTNRPQILDCI